MRIIKKDFVTLLRNIVTTKTMTDNMRRLVTFLLLLTAMLPMEAQEKQLAFPTADGYGKYATGGRGGKVYYVTRNDDCTDEELVIGTLRWALRSGDDSPRTVLFNTHGTIYLTSKLKMNHPNVSILGQSAPGGGVCVAGYPLNVNQDNVIIRYIRFRAGDIPNESLTGLDIENCKNIIVDHCSITWSMEECLTAYDTDYTTIQWCIVGEGLYNSKNVKGDRAYATQWGGEHSTMHHTLITNSHSRSPRFNGVRSQDKPNEHDLHVDSEFANNVVFNWSRHNSIYGGENASNESDAYNRVYMINNYYRPGPATKQNTANNRYFMAGSGDNASQLGEWYLQGNKFETASKWAPSSTVWSDEELEKVNTDNYYGFTDNKASRAVSFWSVSPSQEIYENNLLKSKPELSGLTYESADDAFTKVTSLAGASLPRYDEVDQRLLDEASGRIDPQFAGPTLPNEKGIIDSPDDITLQEHDTYQVNGTTYTNYPFLGMREGDRYIVDSDSDGLPDSYETFIGLQPNNPEDATQIAANGYTYLENYLNGIADGTIQKKGYETSDTQVEVNSIPETLTIRFENTDATVEGTLPADIIVNYGNSFTLPAKNIFLYKEGYTQTGWKRQDYNATYAMGATVTPAAEHVYLPVFTANRVSLDKRPQATTIAWDFIAPEAPKLEGTGIYVTQVMLGKNEMDVKLSYEGTSVTVPADQNAVATIIYATDKQKIIAEGKTLTISVTDVNNLQAISISLPFVPYEDSHVYHTPKLASGKDFELMLTPDAATIEAADWLEVEGGDPRYTYRSCFDPVADDGVTEIALNGTTINNSTRILNAYVTGTATIRAFVSGSNSQGDKVTITATPNDGTPSLSFITMNTLARNGTTTATRTEIVELNLDKTKKYQISFSSVNNLDMMVGALKLYPEEYVDPADADKVPLTTVISPDAAGSVQRSPSGKRYMVGTVVTLTAVPAIGYLFKNWTNEVGDILSDKPSLTYTVSGETTLTANFQSYNDYAHIFEGGIYDAEVRTTTELLVALGTAKYEAVAGRYRIFLHNGVYDLAEKVMTEVPANVSLIGENMEGVVIVNHPDPTSLTTDNRAEMTPTLYLPGDNVYLQDLTVKQGLDYGTSGISGQALAIRSRGDRQVFKNVKMLGCQDTYYINKSSIRNYLENCYIAGDVDFIYGDGTAFLNNCTIYFNATRGTETTGVITAPNTPASNQWGIVISDCTIDGPTAASGNIFLGRPWNDSPAATYVNNTFKILPTAAGWTTMSVRKVLRFHEYGSKDAAGQLLDLSSRSTTALYPAKGSDNPVISAEVAATYTIANVMGGEDGWDPQILTSQTSVPVLSSDGTTISWEAVDNAYCYAVCKNGEVIDFTKDTQYITQETMPEDDITVRVANIMGGLGMASNTVHATGIKGVSNIDENHSSSIYDLMGRKVKTLKPGSIYICNGKKIIQ